MYTEIPRRSFYERFLKGELGLAKTYWVCGVVPAFFAGITVRTVSSNTLAYWIGTGLVVYQCILLAAVWNAGKKYQGSKIWPVLAFLMVLMAVLRNIGAVLDIGRY
ncbi:hypothetical protein [Massilia sp. NR 4-1]|uniref:hypothetical protein n=1 Tax=Massilia sp. NR 4-1 TaxID=1678028 RepID=UPI00067BAC49|nr:hypothetical protein [Massilia sp. NR 4-1]AKU21437.1 hypothetical protein ACZ75_08060 [Massilia sp. NR 4-1]